MQQVSLYSYPTRVSATVVTGSERTYNMPLESSTIKIHRGANMPLEFVLFDADSKPITVGAGKHLELRITNARTRKTISTQRLEKVVTLTQQSKAGALTPSVRGNNTKRSIYRAVISASDTADVSPGSHYIWTVLMQDTFASAEYFYTNRGHNTTGEVHILDNAFPQMEASEIITPENFLMNEKPDLMDEFIVGDSTNVHKFSWKKYTSSAISGDAFNDASDGLHTTAFYTDNFSGVVQLQGTLENMPPDSIAEHRWFNIPAQSGQVNVEFQENTSITPMNYIGNFMWIRVVYYKMEPNKGDNGTITRVVLRR